MAKLKSLFGYGAAVLVIAVMVLAPFILMSRIERLVRQLGLRSHPKFSGGPVVRVLDRGGYRVAIAAPAGPVGPLEWGPRFIQVSWSPVAALPDIVDERLDLDGRGRPQVRLRFHVPRDPRQPLTGQVEVLDPSLVRPVTLLRRTGGPGLLVRLDHSIVARIPLN